MGKNYKLSFSELVLEKGNWGIKQSVLEISSSEDFLRFFTIFSNYDLSKLGFTNFKNSNIFLKNISKDRILREKIELFLTEEKFLQLLKNDGVVNYVKDSKIIEENFLKFLYELKKNHIKSLEKLLLLKDFLNLQNNELFDLYHKIYKKEKIFETNILFNDIIEDKFTYVLAIIRGKLQKLIFEKIKNQKTQKLGDENFMERENVLEIEIIKVNDKFSSWYIKKINERKLKHINPNELDRLGNDILCFGCGEIYPQTKFNKERIDRTGLYGEYYEYQINLEIKYKNNYDEPYFIKNEYVEDLKNIVNSVNEKYGIPKKWRAKQKKGYYYIHSSGLLDENMECYNNIDNNRYNLGNYFQTKEEAQKVIDSKEWQEFWERVRNGEIGAD